MAMTVNAAVSLPSSKSSSLSLKNSITIPERINFNKSFLYARNVSVGGNVVSIRAQVTTEAPAKVAKVSKKDDEGVVKKFKPKDPYIGKCLLNTRITGDDAPGETWHMVFSTEGEVPYREGQSIGVIPDGIDKNGKPTNVDWTLSLAVLWETLAILKLFPCVSKGLYTPMNKERE